MCPIDQKLTRTCLAAASAYLNIELLALQLSTLNPPHLYLGEKSLNRLDQAEQISEFRIQYRTEHIAEIDPKRWRDTLDNLVYSSVVAGAGVIHHWVGVGTLIVRISRYVVLCYPNTQTHLVNLRLNRVEPKRMLPFIAEWHREVNYSIIKRDLPMQVVWNRLGVEFGEPSG